jgi:small basic protein
MEGLHRRWELANLLQREVPMVLRKGFIVGVVITVLIVFLGTPHLVGAEEANEPTGTEITFDLIIARPLGFVGVALGTSIFVASLPFAVATGSTKDTANALVAEPYNFTFVRDLGEY